MLNCVKFEIKDGQLTLVASVSYTLAVNSFDLAQDDGEVLIHRDGIMELIPVLKRARWARLGIVAENDPDGGMASNSLEPGEERSDAVVGFHTAGG